MGWLLGSEAQVAWVLAVGSLLAMTAISGCSLVADANRVQCRVTADCPARGSEFAKAECIDTFCVVPNDTSSGTTCASSSECKGLDECSDGKCANPYSCMAKPQAAASVHVTVKVTDTNLAVLPNVPVRVCRNIDPPCATPFSVQTSDASGVAPLTLPPDFSGYLELVQAPFMPQLQVLPPNPQEGDELDVVLSPSQVIGGLAQYLGASLDPNRGHIYFTLLNCTGRAGGVRVSTTAAAPDTVTYYVLDGLPSGGLTATSPKDGAAGFLNYPVGNTAISVTSERTGLAIDKISLVVRAGFVTYAVHQLTVEQ